MPDSVDANDVAEALQLSIGLLRRRLRQGAFESDLTFAEASALARLERGGPSTPSAIAKLEQISPQSVGATLASLERRGLVERSGDPEDGRHVIISLTSTGSVALRNRRNARTEQLAHALSSHFTHSELRQLMGAAPLIERLAQTI